MTWKYITNNNKTIYQKTNVVDKNVLIYIIKKFNLCAFNKVYNIYKAE
jgi:hypothetical protein